MATDILKAVESGMTKVGSQIALSNQCCTAAKRLTTNEETYDSLSNGYDVYVIKVSEDSKRTIKYRRCGRSVFSQADEPLCWKHYEVRNNDGFHFFSDIASNPSARKASIEDYKAKMKKKEGAKPTKYNAKKLELQQQQQSKDVLIYVVKKTPEIVAICENILKWIENPTLFIHSSPSEDTSLPESNVSEQSVQEPDDDTSNVNETEDVDLEVDINETEDVDLEVDDESDTEEVSLDEIKTVNGTEYGFDGDDNSIWLVGNDGQGAKVGILTETSDGSAPIHMNNKFYFIREEEQVKYKRSKVDKCFHSSRCYKNGKYIGTYENGNITA